MKKSKGAIFWGQEEWKEPCENSKSVRTLEKCEITKICCRVSAEEGMKEEFERGCILTVAETRHEDWRK